MSRRHSVVAAGLGVGALVVAMTGTGVAAGGKSLLLGTSNVAAKPTTISNSKGSALVLKAKKDAPPLTVGGNTTEVPKLDASLLGGMKPAELLSSAAVFTTPGSSPLTVPAGYRHAIMIVIGGGGAGGGGDRPGGSGGQGGYTESLATVKPGQVLQVEVGAAGAGAVSKDGGHGGTSAVFASKTSADYYAESDGGGGGELGLVCPKIAAAGTGGASRGSSEHGTTAGTHVLTMTDGADGQAGTWTDTGTGTCPETKTPGIAPGVGFAGAGGVGGTTSQGSATPGGPGEAGLVIVEFLT